MCKADVSDFCARKSGVNEAAHFTATSETCPGLLKMAFLFARGIYSALTIVDLGTTAALRQATTPHLPQNSLRLRLGEKLAAAQLC